MLWQLWLLVLLSVSSSSPSLAGGCQVHHQAYTPNVKRLSNTAALLSVHGPTTWLPKGADQIHVTLSSGIEQGKDFFIWVSPYKLPEQTYMTLYLQLYPGKVWSPGLKQRDIKALYLQSVLCQDTTASPSLSPMLLATVFHKPPSCPSPPFTLPGSTIQLQQFVTKVVTECQDPLVVRAEHLQWRLFSSTKLLLMQPAILIVDGTGQSLDTAASMVDAFLGAHAVLSIAWEPSNAEVRSAPLSMEVYYLSCMIVFLNDNKRSLYAMRCDDMM